MLAVGHSFIAFSTLSGDTFIKVFFGDRWATGSAVNLVHAGCVYCFFMSLNGIAEAFVFAKGSPSALKSALLFMTVNQVLMPISGLVLV
jgi:O-antigen/teichoic acid export membrane protein